MNHHQITEEIVQRAVDAYHDAAIHGARTVQNCMRAALEEVANTLRAAWKAGQDAPAQPIAEKAEPDHRASPLDVDLSWLRKAVYSYPLVEAQHALHRVEQRLTAQEPQSEKAQEGEK